MVRWRVYAIAPPAPTGFDCCTRLAVSAQHGMMCCAHTRGCRLHPCQSHAERQAVPNCLVKLMHVLVCVYVLIVECGRKGIAVKPKKGSALLFWSLHPDSKTKDPTSLHGGCPVILGDKWSATK